MFNPYSSIPILDDGDSTGWNIYMFRADDKGIQNIINSCYAVKMKLPEYITYYDSFFEDLGFPKEAVRNGDVRIIKSNSRYITISYGDKSKEIEKGRLAEFLKNYKFVKEFGEGVNRMCNELEQVGLKDPVYHTNAFMLQAVIYNSKVGKTIVEKTADSLKKLAVAVNKSLIDYQKPAIGEEKSAIEQQKYNEPSKANILKVYDEIEKNQIFGTKEIKEILDCSPSTARAVMTKLRDMKVVKVVNGKGKGKYVFIE